MKNIALLLVLLISVFSLGQKKPNPTDYPTTVHVSSVRLFFWPRAGVFWEGSAVAQKLNVIIDGKKYELTGATHKRALLTLGDYKARRIEDKPKTAYESSRRYEFLLPDNTTREFIVSGESE